MTTVRYPPKAAKALGLLKSHNNDIDIFVEDTAAPNMWLKLLRKFLPPEVRLKSVTPLGGREQVISACRADQKDRQRKRLYIIDADMDILQGKSKPRLRHLYRLKRYCIENYMISQKSINQAIMSLSPKTEEKEITDKLNIDKWISNNREYLKSIFIAYAVSSKLSLGSKTVGYSCYKLFDQAKKFHYCRIKIRGRIISIYRDAAKAVGMKNLRDAHEEICRNAKSKSIIEYCSAKDYIFPAIYAESARSFGVVAKMDVFKTIICDHIDSSVDPHLRRRLAKL